MKKVLSILSLILILSFDSFGQTPYVEYSTNNFTLISVDRTVTSIRYIIDNTNPVDKKTYIFYQKAQGIAAYIPNVPAGWVTYVGDFEQPTTLHFLTGGAVNGIIDENGSYYLKVNGN